MRILSADLHDYMSFHDCLGVKFHAGINLIVGINNSGKSALLKALKPGLPAQANRSEERFRSSELTPPVVTLKIETSGDRIKQAALEYTGDILIPVPIDTQYQGEAEKFLYNFFDEKRLKFSVPHHGGNFGDFVYPAYGSFGDPNRRKCMTIRNIGGKLRFAGLSSDTSDTVRSLISSICIDDIFFFSAERLNVGSGSLVNARRLSENAANLPAFLLTLMGERGDIIDRLKAHLRVIFPTIGNFSIRPNSSGQIEIVIWPTEAMDRSELSFLLSDSGTGLGQVLAILSVVMTTAESVIIIDEINSFLHPGAVKALLRLFQTEYSHHQYIISTHSPEVISFSNPSVIHVVRRQGYRSQVHSLAGC